MICPGSCIKLVAEIVLSFLTASPMLSLVKFLVKPTSRGCRVKLVSGVFYAQLGPCIFLSCGAASMAYGVSGQGVESELQLPSMPLQRQCQILNPLWQVGD